MSFPYRVSGFGVRLRPRPLGGPADPELVAATLLTPSRPGVDRALLTTTTSVLFEPARF